MTQLRVIKGPELVIEMPALELRAHARQYDEIWSLTSRGDENGGKRLKNSTMAVSTEQK